MSSLEAKENGYTHYAEMYGINGFVRFDEEGFEFQAKYLFTDIIHECIVYLDSLIGFNEYGFKVKVKGTI